jgi:opacity protein-like surface antigen
MPRAPGPVRPRSTPACRRSKAARRFPGSGLNGDFSAGISDILEALNFGAFGTVSRNYGEFGILADLQYSNIGTEATLGGPFGTVLKNGTKLTIVTLAGTYRVVDDEASYLDILAGARFVSTDVTLSTTRTLPVPVTRNASADDTFVDPIVGIRGALPLSARWSVQAMANVGGFGVGSEFSWEAYLGASYAISSAFVADLGFRFLSIDRAADRLDYDLQMFGPVAGITYRF